MTQSIHFPNNYKQDSNVFFWKSSLNSVCDLRRSNDSRGAGGARSLGQQALGRRNRKQPVSSGWAGSTGSHAMRLGGTNEELRLIQQTKECCLEMSWLRAGKEYTFIRLSNATLIISISSTHARVKVKLKCQSGDVHSK